MLIDFVMGLPGGISVSKADALPENIISTNIIQLMG